MRPAVTHIQTALTNSGRQHDEHCLQDKEAGCHHEQSALDESIHELKILADQQIELRTGFGRNLFFVCDQGGCQGPFALAIPGML